VKLEANVGALLVGSFVKDSQSAPLTGVAPPQLAAKDALLLVVPDQVKFAPKAGVAKPAATRATARCRERRAVERRARERQVFISKIARWRGTGSNFSFPIVIAIYH
jgi:hypothetical protein